MLKARLKTCLNYIPNDSIILDVGSDHAYLPIAAILEKKAQKAYAVDNKKGPLNGAINNIKAHHLEAKIIPLLSDGIRDLKDDVDTVIIAGMGGKTIYNILHQKPYKNVQRFILQANVYFETVRRLTINNPLKIVSETVVLEDGLFYPIIVLEKGTQVLTEKELTFGPILLKDKSAAFKKMLTRERAHIERILKQMPKEADNTSLIKKHKMIEEVMYDWS